MVVALAAVVIVAVVLVVLSMSSGGEPPVPRDDPGRGPSIYQQIRAQLREAPERALDVGAIQTDDPAEEGQVRFAPGALDALCGSGGGGDEWKQVLAIIRRLSRGETVSWRMVDAVTAGAPAASNVDRLTDQLRTTDLTPAVRERFWEVALESRRTESVKWGIVIGGLALQPEESDPLLALAHHAEFTLYAAHVLMREGERDRVFAGSSSSCCHGLGSGA